MSWQGLHKSKYENGIFVKENKVKEMEEKKEGEKERGGSTKLKEEKGREVEL